MSLSYFIQVLESNTTRELWFGAWKVSFKALEEVDAKVIEFHGYNGDFESWAQSSLKDQKLASKLKEIKASKETGKNWEKHYLILQKNVI